jgi:F-type H+-transporting ATPase subunit epsilon
MADDNLFAINLVTPERILITGMAAEVILRTADGDVTFLAGHTPLVGTVEPGVLRVGRADGTVERVAVHGGFVQVEKNVAFDDNAAAGAAGTGAADGATGTRVTLLVGVAELAEEIDTERARVALEAAEAQVAELGGATGRSAGTAAGEGEETDPDLMEAQGALLRAQVRLEAADTSAGVTSTAG